MSPSLVQRLFYLWAEWSTAQWASGWSPIDWRSWLPGTSVEFGKQLAVRDGSLIIVGWGLDALFIGAVIWILVRFRKQLPFCERCECWTNVQTGYLLFEGCPFDDEWIQFRKGNFAILRTIPLLQEQSQTHMRLDLASCPGCSTSRYVLIRAFYPSAFRSGKPAEELFVPFQELSPEEADEIGELSGEVNKELAAPRFASHSVTRTQSRSD